MTNPCHLPPHLDLTTMTNPCHSPPHLHLTTMMNSCHNHMILQPLNSETPFMPLIIMSSTFTLDNLEEPRSTQMTTLDDHLHFPVVTGLFDHAAWFHGYIFFFPSLALSQSEFFSCQLGSQKLFQCQMNPFLKKTRYC